jgi:RNA polymerase sigma-70 factor (ECF subfamily)
MVTNDSATIPPAPLADPVFLQGLRKQMLRFANSQLSDASLAEDVVQEALIGALKNVRSFGGRAALKTWVFAILKNKIADALRQKKRLTEANDLLRRDEEDADLGELFDQNGVWRRDERPTAWGNPEVAAREKDFWQVFEACLEHLPGQQARVFMSREFVGMDSEEICAVVGISSSNLHVMLYRARLRLRACLENNWFLEGDTKC